MEEGKARRPAIMASFEILGLLKQYLPPISDKMKNSFSRKPSFFLPRGGIILAF
jgi:hypothetical protein